MTVERPLRLNFTVNAERIAAFKQSRYFKGLVTSKKRKNKAEMDKEIAAGQTLQTAIEKGLKKLEKQLNGKALIKNRDEFETIIKPVFEAGGIKFDAALKKALLAAGSLAEKDATADECTDSQGNFETDGDLRDTENVPLPKKISLPLPLAYENKGQNKGKVDKTELLALVQGHCEQYLKDEVLPYRSDAWIDHSKIKLGYDIPFNRHFYEYEPPRELVDIEADIKGLEQEIIKMLAEVV